MSDQPFPENVERRKFFPYDSTQQTYGHPALRGSHLYEPKPSLGPEQQTFRGQRASQRPGYSNGQQRSRSRSPRSYSDRVPQVSQPRQNATAPAISGTGLPQSLPIAAPPQPLTESPLASLVGSPLALTRSLSDSVQPVTPRYLSADIAKGLLYEPLRLTSTHIWCDDVGPTECEALLDEGSIYNCVSKGLLARLGLYHSKNKEIRKWSNPEEMFALRLQAGSCVDVPLVSKYSIKLGWRLSAYSTKYENVFHVVENLPLDLIINQATINKYNLRDLKPGSEYRPDLANTGIIFTVVSKLHREIRALQQQLDEIKSELDAAKGNVRQWSQAAQRHGDRREPVEKQNAARNAASWQRRVTQLQREYDDKRAAIGQKEEELRRRGR